MHYTRVAVVFFLFLVSFQVVIASEHYNFEHAEEMRLSGRIDWYDYGPDAFADAVTQNKPIFLLLTAPSWCYWCHVYTSDDYIYHPDVYPLINEKYIPVYVDADKRQDLTRKYLEGGWPSTTVLTPSLQRLYGYSGPRPIENMIANLDSAASHVSSRGFSNTVYYNYEKTPVIIPQQIQFKNLINSYTRYILQVYDQLNGGFGNGQKFPQGRTLDFSLELYELTGNSQWLELVQNTLQNQYTKSDELQTNYNLFDPIEGGFHRYGTRVDWSPPHYEKMLYDNARLLKAYSHLQQLIPEDLLVQEVVSKTIQFIERNWWDTAGGFYGNSDVHGEDEYYGKINRPKPTPRVEKTKYSDWNSDAISAYLFLWQTTSQTKYRDMAAASLDFFSREMVTDTGAYHYKTEDGQIGIRGSILDNAYLLLAFVEGYEVLRDEAYLDTAENLAQYSLDNLYDWHSGGFFERNSPDKDLYAPGESVDLTKPLHENGVMAYAMLRLYNITNNSLYLNAGLKTVSANINQVPGLDRGYFYVKAAQFTIQNNLLADFQSHESELAQLEAGKQENFWLNDLLANQPSPDVQPEFVVLEQGLEKLEAPLFLLIVIALIAGFISFASPCSLPILPAYIAYSLKASQHSIKGLTVAFFLGLSFVFTLLGMSASVLGNLLRSHLTLFSQIAGILIIFFGVYILLGKGFQGFKFKKDRPTSYLGSFLFGAALGLSWTPCVGPILVALLLLASTSSSVVTGGVLLFVYSIGLALPLIFISAYLGKINKEGKLWKIIEGKELRFKLFSKSFSVHTTSLVSGLLFIILGYLMFSGVLFAFNQYVAATSFQKLIFGLEDWILNLVK